MSLTIKHIEPSGHESIQSCEAVSFTPFHVKDGEQEYDRDTLRVYGCNPGIGGAIDDGGTCLFSYGTVYVMNENGATVGKYQLG